MKSAPACITWRIQHSTANICIIISKFVAFFPLLKLRMWRPLRIKVTLSRRCVKCAQKFYWRKTNTVNVKFQIPSKIKLKKKSGSVECTPPQLWKNSEDYRGKAATGKWYQRVRSTQRPNTITGRKREKRKKKQPPAAKHPLRFEVHLSHETQPRLTSKGELQWLNACQLW